MTVICWDGVSIAADCQGTTAGLRRLVHKLVRVKIGDKPEEVLALAGEQSMYGPLVEWYKSGADPEKYPKRQETDDYSTVMVASRAGLKWYGRQPYPAPCADPFTASGSGRDYAIAAMHLGKTAKEAVEIASLFDTDCGMGVDVIYMEELK